MNNKHITKLILATMVLTLFLPAFYAVNESRIFYPSSHQDYTTPHARNQSTTGTLASLAATAGAVAAYYLAMRKREVNATIRGAVTIKKTGSMVSGWINTHIITPVWNFLNTDVDITGLWNAARLVLKYGLPFTQASAISTALQRKFMENSFKQGRITKEQYNQYIAYFKQFNINNATDYIIDGAGYWILGVNRDQKTGKTTIKVYDLLLDLAMAAGAIAKVVGAAAKGLGFIGRGLASAGRFIKASRLGKWLSASARVLKTSRVAEFLARGSRVLSRARKALRGVKAFIKARRPAAAVMRWLSRVSKGRPWLSRGVSKLKKFLKAGSRFADDISKIRFSISKKGITLGFKEGYVLGKWMRKLANHVSAAKKYRLLGFDLGDSHFRLSHLHIGPLDNLLKGKYLGGALRSVKGPAARFLEKVVTHPLNSATAAVIAVGGRAFRARHHVRRVLHRFRRVYHRLRHRVRHISHRARRLLHKFRRHSGRFYHRFRRKYRRFKRRIRHVYHKIKRHVRRVYSSVRQRIRRWRGRFKRISRRIRHYRRRIKRRSIRQFKRTYRRIRRRYRRVRRRVRRVYHRVKRRVRRVYHRVKRRVRHVYNRIKRHVGRVYSSVRRGIRSFYHRLKRRVRRFFRRRRSRRHRAFRRPRRRYRRVRRRVRRVYHRIRRHFRRPRRRYYRIKRRNRRRYRRPRRRRVTRRHYHRRRRRYRRHSRRRR